MSLKRSKSRRKKNTLRIVANSNKITFWHGNEIEKSKNWRMLGIKCYRVRSITNYKSIKSGTQRLFDIFKTFYRCYKGIKKKTGVHASLVLTGQMLDLDLNSLGSLCLQSSVVLSSPARTGPPEEKGNKNKQNTKICQNSNCKKTPF